MKEELSEETAEKLIEGFINLQKSTSKFDNAVNDFMEVIEQHFEAIKLNHKIKIITLEINIEASRIPIKWYWQWKLKRAKKKYSLYKE